MNLEIAGGFVRSADRELIRSWSMGVTILISAPTASPAVMPWIFMRT